MYRQAKTNKPPKRTNKATANERTKQINPSNRKATAKQPQINPSNRKATAKQQ